MRGFLDLIEGACVLLVVGLMLQTCAAQAETDCIKLLPLCQAALGSCDEASRTLQKQVVDLKAAEAAWRKEVQRDVPSGSLVLPVAAGAAAGAAGGYASSRTSGGTALGSLVGAGVGAVVGLVFGGR